MIRPPRTCWTVEWAANAYGYQVVVRTADGVLIDSGSAGNHLDDELATVPLDSPDAAPENKLRRRAMNAANQLAEENRVPEFQIRENPDLLKED